MLKILRRLRLLAPAAPLLIFFGLLFGNLLQSHMVQQKNDGLYSGGATWGDLAWHLSLSSRFAEAGLRAVEDNPLFPGVKLSYPFVPDFLSGWLVSKGVPLQASLIWPSLAVLLASVLALYLLSHRISGGNFGALTTPFLVLFNGSVLGCYYLWQDYKASEFGSQFLNVLPVDYTHLPRQNIHFSNFTSEYLLPQRAAAFGFFLGTIVMLFLWRYWESSERKSLLFAGWVLSAMPLVHFHSFVSLSIAASSLCLIQLVEDRRSWRSWAARWALFTLPMALVALPLVLWILPAKEDFLRVQLGWMSEQDSAWWFWARNLAPHLLVFVVAFTFAPTKLRTFFLAFCSLFLLGNIILFQPNPFDNMKLFFWWFIAGCLVTGRLFQKLLNRLSFRGAMIALLVMSTMVASGTASVWRELHLSWRMFTPEDIALADYVKQHSDVDAIFLTSDKHNHPVTCLAGRQVVMGYRGWLWTHGIDYRQREHDVLEMYSGEGDANALLKHYGVDLVLIEQDKARDFYMNARFFEKQYPVVFRSRNYTLLKLAP